MSTPIPSLKATLITLPLTDLVHDLLGDRGNVVVGVTTANLIYQLTKNETLCHVMFPSDHNVNVYGVPINKPVLWELGYWRSSCERWLSAKLYHESERKKQYVMEENVRRVAKRVRLTFEHITDEQAKMLAYQYIRKGDDAALEFFKVGKLAERVEDI